MPKMKTKKTLAKRVKVTASGKLKKRSNYTSHFAAKKENTHAEVINSPLPGHKENGKESRQRKG